MMNKARKARFPKIPRGCYIDSWGCGNSVYHTPDQKRFWKVENGKVTDFATSYDDTRAWTREFIAKQPKKEGPFKDGIF